MADSGADTKKNVDSDHSVQKPMYLPRENACELENP